jgi:ribonuclease P protein component
MKKTKMLKKNYEFKQVLSKGKYYQGEHISCFIKKNNKNHNLLGLAISVKSGKAVKRNKVKRLLRENYKNLEDFLQEGESIIFLLKKHVNIDDVNYNNINKDMEKIFNDAKIFK